MGMDNNYYLHGYNYETAMREEKDFKKMNLMFDNYSIHQNNENNNFENSNVDGCDFYNNVKNNCGDIRNRSINKDDSNDNDDNNNYDDIQHDADINNDNNNIDNNVIIINNTNKNINKNNHDNNNNNSNNINNSNNYNNNNYNNSNRNPLSQSYFKTPNLRQADIPSFPSKFLEHDIKMLLTPESPPDTPRI